MEVLYSAEDCGGGSFRGKESGVRERPEVPDGGGGLSRRSDGGEGLDGQPAVKSDDATCQKVSQC